MTSIVNGSLDKRKKIVQKILNKYFPHPKISLKHKNLYTFLIAIILSAQSSDAIVNKITKDLFKRIKTPQDMIKLGEKKLKKIIKPIGLYNTKAKVIIKMSKILIKNYNSNIPNTFEALESLPGVGHKTASVLMSQGFNKKAFAVDTHVARLAKRWKLSNGKNVKEIEEDLKKIFPPSKWRDLHLQMIYFGRLFCKSKGHIIKKCPICSKIKKQ